MDTPSLGNAPFGRNNIRRAVLTASKVAEIRQLYGKGAVTQGQLSRDYGVSVVQIGRIVRGEVWQGLGPVQAGARELEESAQRMMELQDKLNRGEVERKRVEAEKKLPSHDLTPQSVRDRAAAYLDPQVALERPAGTAKASGRVIPLSPLEGGDGGADETQGEGLKKLVNNASGLCGDNANELLKELS